MSILSGYGKFKRYVLTDDGYKLCSQWTSSNTVHFDDGKTAQDKLGAINGITDSLTSTNSNVALSAKSGKNLQDQITELNTDLGGKANSSHTHDYLPLTGGTMTGDIHLASGKGLILNGNTCYIGRGAAAEMIALYGGQIRFYPEGWSTNASLESVVKIGKDGTTYALYTSMDNKYQLGLSNIRWKQLYAANSVISTSDETMKRNIKPLDENLILQFIMGLDPISYIRTDAESGRRHWGLGAQTVEKLMGELGIDSMDFAGLIKSPKKESILVEIEHYEDEQVEEVDKNGKKVITTQKVRKTHWETETREIPGEYRYGLRYEEFIAPIIKVVQIQQEVINNLKKENSNLLCRLEKVEKALGLAGNI